MSRSPETLTQQAELLRNGDSSSSSRFINAKTVSLAAAATLFAANHFGGDRMWRSDPTTLRKLPYDGPSTSTAGIVVPGLGSLSGKDMAYQIATAIPTQMPWGYVDYDNHNGITRDEVTDQVKQYQKEQNAESLDLYGPSMGFPFGLTVAKDAGVPLRYIMANSSPYHMEDGYGSKIGDFIVRNTPYDFRIVGKLVGTLLANSVRKGMKGFRRNYENVKEAVKETWRGASPALFRSQVDILRKINLDDQDFTGILIPGYTEAVYFSPLGKNDDVVNVDQAYPKLKSFFHKYGIPLPRIEMPYAEHADTAHAVIHGKPWFEKTYRGKENVVFSREAV